jgi:ribosomal protein S18 acetylase RimI-like enzyme
MFCREATVEEFMSLWNYSGSNTYKYFLKGIQSNEITFLTIIDNDKLISELYIFWDSPDKEEANGISRAYLCALRVQKDYRGKGLSSMMIEKAKEIAVAKGFNELTIGVDNDNYAKLSSIYDRWGFNTIVKQTNIDYHYRDENNNPHVEDEAWDLRAWRT